MTDASTTTRLRRTLAAMAVLAGGLIGAEAAQAAPLSAPPAATVASDPAVETVQHWRHHHHGWGHRRHWGHRHHGWGHRHWGHRHHGWGHRHHY